MRSKCHPTRLSIAPVAVLLVTGSPALAQQPATATTGQQGIAEIIVTAERREQSVQKAPLSIQVIQGSDLEKAGITDALGLTRVTSGVQIAATGANTQIFVRGVGSFSALVTSSPGVAFNVDGVYVNQGIGTNGNFYDLSRVEVLKGPQGTLYGRNATGGAINLITNQPELGKRTFDLNLEAGNYDYLRATGAINIPLGDSLAARAAFNVINRNGFLSDGQDDDVEQSGRLRVKWAPSSTVSVLLNADYSHLGGNGGDYVYLPRRPGSDPWESSTSAAANGYRANFLPGLGSLLVPLEPSNAQDVRLANFSAQLDWKLPFATLTLLPAHRHMNGSYLYDFASSDLTRSHVNENTLEARLGNDSGRLNWVAGGYYYHEKASSTEVISLLPIYNQIHRASQDTTSYAAFGQATFKLTDGLKLIGGARYTHERPKVEGTTADLPSLIVREIFSGRRSFHNVSYKAGAEYDVAQGHMVYATYSTGYKAGGFSQVSAPNSFEPEKLRATEIGSKNRFLEHHLQINFGGFYWKYRNIQDARPGFSTLGNISLITFNSGNATIYGGTLEVVARPTARDTLQFSGEYAHSSYSSFAYLTPSSLFSPASTGCSVSGPYAPGAALPRTANGSDVNNYPLPVTLSDCTGFQVARTPKWSGTASWDHDFVLPAGDRLTLDASVNFSSARWIGVDFLPGERDGAYAIVDANLTYSPARGDWSIGLFGRNLTKTAYYTGGLETLLPGLIAANIGAPRTFGVRAGFRFGH
jgi:iron complex outermembrane receptor protein